MVLDKEVSATQTPKCSDCAFHDIKLHDDQVFDRCNNVRWDNNKNKTITGFDCDEERSTTVYHACGQDGIHFKQRQVQEPRYCNDCRYCKMTTEMAILDDCAKCTKTRVVQFINLVTGPYTREYVDMSCKSERYPDIEYVLPSEKPCGREGKYFEPKEKI